MLALVASACGSGAEDAVISIPQAPGNRSGEDEAAKLATVQSGKLAVARVSHTSSMLPNGRVVVAGSKGVGTMTFSGPPRAAVEIWDPETGEWTLKTPMHKGREHHRAVLLSDGRLLVVGGSGPISYLSSSETYDPATDSWTLTANLAQARSHHSLTALEDGRVLAARGKVASYLEDAEVYDPSTDSWIQAGTLSTKRAYHRGTRLQDGRVILTGGKLAGVTALASSEIFDPIDSS